MTMKKARVGVHMGRGDHHVSIDITDSTSGIEIIHLDLTLEELASLLVSSGPRTAKAEVTDSFDRIGKVRESRAGLVMVDALKIQEARAIRPYDDSQRAVVEAISAAGKVAAYALGDGWIFCPPRTTSRMEWDEAAHCAGNMAFKGAFVRYVSPSTDPCGECGRVGQHHSTCVAQDIPDEDPRVPVVASPVARRRTRKVATP